MHVAPQDNLDAADLRVAIVVSRYHEAITSVLRDGAVSTFIDAGGAAADVTVIEAAGTFELTALARALAGRADVDAVVALGCVIRGETMHDQYLAQAVAHGLTQITLETGTPVAFGVLTCQTLHQARERAGGGHGNKGVEAMAAVIETARTLGAIAATPVDASGKERQLR